jgi:urease accessory protein
MDTADHLGRLRLWQLLSPALPVGAYAYSRGLEYALSAGWLRDEPGVSDWIEGQVNHALKSLDVPVLARLYRAWQQRDTRALDEWSGFLLAVRESSELLAEDRYLGGALARLLVGLGIAEARPWCGSKRASFAALFALATERWGIALPEAAEAYLWVWCENQVAAAVKLVPLGQTAGQQLLARLAERIPDAARHGLDLSDEAIGGLCPGVAIASALHEDQYTRLFRS